MPLGTTIHNIEIARRRGGQLARAAGVVAKLIAKEGKLATLRLPSGEVCLVSQNCLATVRQVGNVGVNQKSLGRGSEREDDQKEEAEEGGGERLLPAPPFIIHGRFCGHIQN
jgi:ribosomal protein L2